MSALIWQPAHCLHITGVLKALQISIRKLQDYLSVWDFIVPLYHTTAEHFKAEMLLFHVVFIWTTNFSSLVKSVCLNTEDFDTNSIFQAALNMSDCIPSV